MALLQQSDKPFTHTHFNTIMNACLCVCAEGGSAATVTMFPIPQHLDVSAKSRFLQSPTILNKCACVCVCSPGDEYDDDVRDETE